MTRIGLLGGTFNPIHFGHLLLAYGAKEELSLNRVIFIPAAVSPLKKREKKATGNHRYQMVRLAVKGTPFFSVSDIEIRRQGPSYTIETVRAFRKKMPSADFFLLVGSDCLKTFHRWKEAKTLSRACHVAVADRPGYPLPYLPRGFQKFEIPQVDITSSEIRRRIRERRSVVYQVPKAVERYIERNRLYR